MRNEWDERLIDLTKILIVFYKMNNLKIISWSQSYFVINKKRFLLFRHFSLLTFNNKK